MIGGLYRRDWGICMMSSSDSPSRGGTALLLALGAAAALLYARILPYPLIWDDRAFVSGQPFLADCRNLAEVLAPSSFTGVLVVRGAARPVWLASVLADACLAGGWTPAHRLVSAWWHALATMLLAFLARRLTGSLGAGLTAGALFAAHPLHAEVVAIVTFRSDALCLSFMLLSTVLFIEARGRSGAARYLAGAGALGAATLALLSKETAVVLPLLWALAPAPASSRPAPRGGRLVAIAAVACAALAAAYLVWRVPRSGYEMPGSRDAFSEVRSRISLPFSTPKPGSPPPESVRRSLIAERPWAEVYANPGARARTMSRVFGSYLRRLILPTTLQGDYATRIENSWVAPRVWLAWIAWGALLAAAFARRDREPAAAYGVFWMSAALLPVSGAIALLNLEADRYLYAPSAGACLAAGALAAAVARRARARAPAVWAACALLAAALAAQTWRREADFRSEEAFHRAILGHDPGAVRARLSLAMICAEDGREECAREQCREALERWPAYARARELCGRFAIMR